MERLDATPSLRGLYRSAAVSMLRRKPAGDTLPDTELVLPDVGVDRARLSRYDRVCGYRLGDTLPVTYPHVLAFPVAMALMSRPDFPLPLVGLVHIANRIEQRRPIGADERLELRVRAADLRPHDRGRQVDVLADAYVDGEVAWTGRSTYLHRSSSGAASRPASAEVPTVELPRPTASWRVDRRVGPEYAEVSGDRNPIHTSRVGARLFGFPRPIAHGMWSKARCLAALEGRLPDAYTVDVAFKLPILLPARVAYAARARDGGWQLDLRDAKSGKPHLTGTVYSGS
jgi:acyl dehydratase